MTPVLRTLFDQFATAVAGFARAEFGGEGTLDFSVAPPRYVWVPARGKFSPGVGRGIGGRQLLCRNPVVNVYCHGRDFDGAEAMLLALPTVLEGVTKHTNYALGDEIWRQPDGERKGYDGAVVVVPVTLLNLPVYEYAIPSPGFEGRGFDMPGVEQNLIATILAVQARDGGLFDPGEIP